MEKHERRIDLDSIYNPDSFSTTRERECGHLFKRARKPFQMLASNFDELTDNGGLPLDELHRNILISRIENTCRKILMMSKAGIKTIDCEEEIMLGQDREFPALMWDDEIELLYHIEAMILFARSALDIAAYVFSAFLLKRRTDSLHEFCKLLMKTSDANLVDLQKAITSEGSVKTSWLNILRGREKGRSVRDKIAHQTAVRIEYERVKQDWEDLFCHVVVEDQTIALKKFVDEVNNGVIDFCILAEDVILSYVSD